MITEREALMHVWTELYSSMDEVDGEWHAEMLGGDPEPLPYIALIHKGTNGEVTHFKVDVHRIDM